VATGESEGEPSNIRIVHRVEPRFAGLRDGDETSTTSPHGRAAVGTAALGDPMGESWGDPGGAVDGMTGEPSGGPDRLADH
jgi:hypothetical protein